MRCQIILFVRYSLLKQPLFQGAKVLQIFCFCKLQIAKK